MEHPILKMELSGCIMKIQKRSESNVLSKLHSEESRGYVNAGTQQLLKPLTLGVGGFALPSFASFRMDEDMDQLVESTKTACIKNLGWHFARYNNVPCADDPLYSIEPYRNCGANERGQKKQKSLLTMAHK